MGIRERAVEEIRTEEWAGYSIRFVLYHGEWYAILKDLCDALGLRTDKVSERLDSDMLEKAAIPQHYNDGEKIFDAKTNELIISKVPSKDVRSSKVVSTDVRSSKPYSTGDRLSNHLSKGDRSVDPRARGDNNFRPMIIVNELGVYEALFASRKLEARKLRKWTATMLQKLRKKQGLEGWEILDMTNSEVQTNIDRMMDDYFNDKGKWYKSVTVPGGDVAIYECDSDLNPVKCID